MALSFAERNGGRLWATEAPPEAIVAIINQARGEDEYVIDPTMVTGVDITEGVVVGHLCPESQTPDENIEAEVTEATLSYRQDALSRLVGTPKEVTS